MRLAIFATMSRGEGDSRTWFVVDELDALGMRIPAEAGRGYRFDVGRHSEMKPATLPN